MTLNLEINEELEQRLTHAAQDQGITAEKLARQLLEASLRSLDTNLPLSAVATEAEWAQAVEEWADMDDLVVPPLPEEAVRRDSFYGERG